MTSVTNNVDGITRTSNGVKIEPAGSANEVKQSDFLRLMTAQLQNQDPFNPMDGQQMVSQMAEISNVTGIGEMNASLKAIQEQIGEQTKLLKTLQAAQAASNADSASDTDGADSGDSGDVSSADDTTTTNA